MSKLFINGSVENESNHLYLRDDIKTVSLETCNCRYEVPKKVLNDVNRFGFSIPMMYSNIIVGMEKSGTVNLSRYEDILDVYYQSMACVFDWNSHKYLPAVDSKTTIRTIYNDACSKNKELGNGKKCFRLKYNSSNGKATCYFRGHRCGYVTGDAGIVHIPDTLYRTVFDKAGFGVKIIERRRDESGIHSIIYTNDITQVSAAVWCSELPDNSLTCDIYINNGNGTFYSLRNPKVDVFYNGLYSI